ncbi:hypothetical protein MASR2M78_25960 [Treponema sp.]
MRLNGNGAGNGSVKESAGFKPHGEDSAQKEKQGTASAEGLVDIARSAKNKSEDEQAAKIAQARVKGYEGIPARSLWLLYPGS